MPTILPKDLKPGEIYVTAGGIIIIKGNDNKEMKLPWGYDRVRFVRIHEDCIITETPWGTEMSLPKSYLLQTTSERVMRSEHPLRGIHEASETFSFDKALKMGICKEIDELELKKATPAAAVRHHAGTTSKNSFIEDIIKYFSDTKSVASAVDHFGVKYQKIRYTIKNLKAKGYGIQRFTVVTTKEGGLTSVKLEKVEK